MRALKKKKEKKKKNVLTNYLCLIYLDKQVFVLPLFLGGRGPGGDRVFCKEYECNLHDTFRLIGRVIIITSQFGVIYVRYELVVQL